MDGISRLPREADARRGVARQAEHSSRSTSAARDHLAAWPFTAVPRRTAELEFSNAVCGMVYTGLIPGQSKRPKSGAKEAGQG